MIPVAMPANTFPRKFRSQSTAYAYASADVAAANGSGCCCCRCCCCSTTRAIYMTGRFGEAARRRCSTATPDNDASQKASHGSLGLAVTARPRPV